MQKPPAITWIRDGTLIDRMPENAAAFGAIVHQHFSIESGRNFSIEGAINWAFQHSGVSAAEKMRCLNESGLGRVEDVEEAARDYAVLAEELGAKVDYFEGAQALIVELAQKGFRQYITSAISQEILDEWAKTPQGSQIADHVEMLGDGPKGKKGEGHFNWIREQGAGRIYAVADAVAEIQAARAHADVAVGFAHVITPERVGEAFQKVRGETIETSRLKLPTEGELIEMLKRAGATHVVAGTRREMMGKLRAVLVQ